MKTQFSHVVFAIDPANRPFYGDLMSFLGWDTIMDEAEILGVGNFSGPSLWFSSGVNGHRPEFSMSTEETYYQVMFESPDRILFEVVYTGTKQ
jgi:hypothetical protein